MPRVCLAQNMRSFNRCNKLLIQIVLKRAPIYQLMLAVNGEIMHYMKGLRKNKKILEWFKMVDYYM